MNRNRYPVSTMCRFLGVSRSGYYDYIKRLDQPTHNAVLVEIIREQQKKCDKKERKKKYLYLRNRYVIM